jgi:uncharacterized membrane protein
MPTLVVIAYRDETSAAAAGEQVHRLVRHLRVEPDATAVVRRDGDGRYHLTTNHHPVTGDVSWALVWMLMFAPLVGPVPADAGLDPAPELVAAGAVDPRFLAAIRDRLDPGTSALLLAVGAGAADRVVGVLRPYGGEVLRTTPTEAQLAVLRQLADGRLAAEPAVSAGRDRAPGTG